MKCCSCERRFRADCDFLQHVKEEHNVQLKEFQILLKRESLTTSDMGQDIQDNDELPMEESTLPEESV